MTPDASSTPLWGQAWELVITANSDGGGEKTVAIASKTWQPEALRVTFEVVQAMNSSPMWYADISVYNLDSQAEQDLILNATSVRLSAGFQTGPNQLSVIWDGPVFQTIYSREDVVDTKVTFHCIANPFMLDSIVSFAAGPFSTQADLLASMAGQAGFPPLSYAQGTMGQAAAQRTAAVKYPRGNTAFCRLSKYMQQVADSGFMQTFNDGKQVYLSEIDSGKRTPDYIYAPAFPPGGVYQPTDLPPGTTQSIIGTPQQTPQGVVFQVLLDPRLQVILPPKLVQIVRTQLKVLTITPPADRLASPLSANLTFFIGQVTHTGDTRGNTWATEVTGWSTAYAKNWFNLYTG